MRGPILTIPNVLTFIRLMLTPVFIYVALNEPVAGAIMLAILASTDFIDGYIARKFNQESPLGRLLDPISDRLLTICAFIVFITTDSIPLWFVIIFGLREILVSIGTVIIGLMKKVRLDVNVSGKSSALAAMIAVPAWVFHNEIDNAHFIYLSIALAGSIVSIVSGYISIYQYAKAYGALDQS